MGWQNLGEGILASIIATLITNFIFQNRKKKSKEKIKLKLPKDPFLISLSFAVFFGILSLFGFYYGWEKFAYIIVIDFLFIAITIWIKNNQCPKCKKIFKKITHDPEILKEEKRPYRHKDSTVTLYSDGSVKNKKHHGKERIIMETIRTQRNRYSCSDCLYQWKGDVHERNLNKHERPKPNIRRTNIRNPDEPELY